MLIVFIDSPLCCGMVYINTDEFVVNMFVLTFENNLYRVIYFVEVILGST